MSELTGSLNLTSTTEENFNLEELSCACCLITSYVAPLTDSVYGADNYHLAGELQIAFDLLLIAIQITFLKGALPYCGWKSDFSFTLLALLSLNALQYYIFDIVGVFLSILAHEEMLDWLKAQRIFRVVGSFLGTPQFSILFINPCLTLHRWAYVLAPFEAGLYFRPWMAKTCVFLLAFLHFSMCIFWSTDYMGMRYYPAFYSMSIKGGLPYTCTMLAIADQTNLLILANAVLYSLLVLYIILNKKIVIRGNDEIRFTLQAFISVLFELGLFAYYYFVPISNRDSWMLWLLRNTSQLIYCGVNGLIYLIFNRDVRGRAFGSSSNSIVFSIHSGR